MTSAIRSSPGRRGDGERGEEVLEEEARSCCYFTLIIMAEDFTCGSTRSQTFVFMVWRVGIVPADDVVLRRGLDNPQNPSVPVALDGDAASHPRELTSSILPFRSTRRLPCWDELLDDRPVLSPPGDLGRDTELLG